jgi:hypothetical protein
LRVYLYVPSVEVWNIEFEVESDAFYISNFLDFFYPLLLDPHIVDEVVVYEYFISEYFAALSRHAQRIAALRFCFEFRVPVSIQHVRYR